MRILLKLLLPLLCMLVWGCQNGVGADQDRRGTFEIAQLDEDGLPVLKDPEPSGWVKHNPELFTQGLLFSEGLLYESTGVRGESKILSLDPKSGEVSVLRELAPDLFGEGLAEVDGQLYQLTWQAGKCLIYDKPSLEPAGELFYGTQGWGLTNSGDLLVLSDGSATLRFVTSKALIPKRSLLVKDGKGLEVYQLNELEWVGDEIWANVWMTDKIARIDPKSGKVKSWLQFTSLVKQTQNNEAGVLNGIAYDPGSDTLWITGKLWDKIYRYDQASKTFGFSSSPPGSP